MLACRFCYCAIIKPGWSKNLALQLTAAISAYVAITAIQQRTLQAHVGLDG